MKTNIQLEELELLQKLLIMLDVFHINLEIVLEIKQYGHLQILLYKSKLELKMIMHC